MPKEAKPLTYNDYRGLSASEERDLPPEQRSFFMHIYFEECEAENEYIRSRRSERILNKEMYRDLPSEGHLGLIRGGVYVLLFLSFLWFIIIISSNEIDYFLMLFCIFLLIILVTASNKLNNYSTYIDKLYQDVTTKQEKEFDNKLRLEYLKINKLHIAKTSKRFYKEGDE